VFLGEYVNVAPTGEVGCGHVHGHHADTQPDRLREPELKRLNGERRAVHPTTT
jgi:hypothetical protein